MSWRIVMINSLFLRRTRESWCCWNNTHTNNAFVLKLVKPNTLYYWCYGNGCGNGRMFKIDAAYECDDTTIEDIWMVLTTVQSLSMIFFISWIIVLFIILNLFLIADSVCSKIYVFMHGFYRCEYSGFWI